MKSDAFSVWDRVSSYSLHMRKIAIFFLLGIAAAAAAAKSLQSCPTLCDPTDGSPPGPPSLGFSRQEHWIVLGIIKRSLLFTFFLLCCAPLYNFHCCCSVAKLCPTLCNPVDYSMPGFPILHCLPRILLKLMSIDSVMPSSHLVLCHPLLLLPSFFPSIRVSSSHQWVSSSHQVVKVLELQLQSFQWTFRVDLL